MPDAGHSRVFISYSRKDLTFATMVCDALVADGLEPYLDLEDIAAGEDWKARLGDLVAGANAVVFLLSPDSLASPICEWEVDEAERLGKRIIPVLCRPIDPSRIPGRLARLNHVSVVTDAEWAVHYPKLRSALQQDIEWEREKTRLVERASRWEADRKDAHLLNRDALEAALDLVERRPPTASWPEVLRQ